MPLFKTVAIMSGVVAELSIATFPLWIMGIPGTQSRYARG